MVTQLTNGLGIRMPKQVLLANPPPFIVHKHGKVFSEKEKKR